jgi:hypothetical protein
MTCPFCGYETENDDKYGCANCCGEYDTLTETTTMTTKPKITMPLMSHAASEAGFALEFQVTDREVDENEAGEAVLVHIVQAYGENEPYGIYGKISTDDSLPSRFYVVYAEDAGETNGKGYETLEDALRAMESMKANDAKQA